MAENVNCSSCSNALWDDLWGEYKCKEKQRTCTSSEIAMGCDQYEAIGSKQKYPKPEIIVRSGATFIPSVTEDGVLSWSNDKGLPNPKPISLAKGLQGEKGDPGETGPQGPKGDKGEDGKDGVNGKDGEKGADGYTPIKGTDYFTEADKTEMVSAVISALPKYNGEVVSV